jgi:hypothetical protein
MDRERFPERHGQQRVAILVRYLDPVLQVHLAQPRRPS